MQLGFWSVVMLALFLLLVDVHHQKARTQELHKLLAQYARQIVEHKTYRAHGKMLSLADSNRGMPFLKHLEHVLNLLEKGYNHNALQKLDAAKLADQLQLPNTHCEMALLSPSELRTAIDTNAYITLVVNNAINFNDCLSDGYFGYVVQGLEVLVSGMHKRYNRDDTLTVEVFIGMQNAGFGLRKHFVSLKIGEKTYHTLNRDYEVIHPLPTTTQAAELPIKLVMWQGKDTVETTASISTRNWKMTFGSKSKR